MIKSQVRMLASLWWWVRRRHQDLGPGDIAIGYAREQVPMLIAFAGVMALETAVVGLLVPWPIIHVLDGLAVVQILSLATIGVTRPHYLTADDLVIREGALFEVHVPLSSIARVHAARKYHNGPTIELTDDDELNVVIGHQTDVVVTLSSPVNDTVTKIRFRADEPQVAVKRISTRIAELANGERAGVTA